MICGAMDGTPNERYVYQTIINLSVLPALMTMLFNRHDCVLSWFHMMMKVRHRRMMQHQLQAADPHGGGVEVIRNECLLSVIVRVVVHSC